MEIKLYKRIKHCQKINIILLQETTLLLEQERIKWRSSENILTQQLQEEKVRRKEAEE